jgi:predicted HTH domain antitoxin
MDQTSEAAMSRLQIDIPEQTLISLKTDSASFAQELVLLAAVKLFEMGKLSSARAAELAGLSRAEFLMALRRYAVSPFHMTAEELRQDVLNS